MLSLVVSVFAAIVLAAPVPQAPSSDEARVEQFASMPVLGSARLPKGLRPVHASSIELPTIGRVLRLDGSFEYKGSVISFETRRRRELNDEGSVAVEVCFRDSAGRPINVLYAGGESLFADCKVGPDADIDYGVLRRAIRALARAKFNPVFAPEYEVLGSVRSDDPKKIGHHRRLRDLRRLERGEIDGNSETSVDPRSGSLPCPFMVCFKHRIEVYTGLIVYVAGHTTHSATRAFFGVRYYDNIDRIYKWRWKEAWSDPNFGRPYSDFSMFRKCSWTSGIPLRFWDVIHNTCQTLYRLFSVGGFNCNDQSALQVRSVQRNRMLANGPGTAPCHDNSWHTAFKGCDAYTF